MGESPNGVTGSSRPASPVEVVIVGAGFAGLEAARTLAGTSVHVTIVDKHNFHTFLPLLYQVATAGLEPADVAYPVRTIFGSAPNVTFRHGWVVDIDDNLRSVTLKSGDTLHFDHLIVAGGATAAFYGVSGAADRSFPLYTLSDSRRLRNHLLLTLEAADVAGPLSDAPLTFVVVGGGPTGVETAGAIVELLDICVRRDRLRLNMDVTRVVLVEGGPRLLSSFPTSAGDYAARTLTSKGVELLFNTSVDAVEHDAVLLSSGERLATTTVVWAAGVTAAGTLADLTGTTVGSGRVRVDGDLRVHALTNVWAVGDGAAVPTGRGDEVCPQLAQVAIQSGRHCARQILATVEGRSTSNFRYRDKGIMATIGRRSAVAQLNSGLVLKGTVGWIAWMSLHLYFLVGFRNRLRVFINWTWRYFDWPSGPRLIVSDVNEVET